MTAMTLFEYIITNLFNIDKNEKKDLIVQANKTNNYYDFICLIKSSNYFTENKKHAKILFNILFSAMFRLIKEEKNVPFYKIHHYFNSKNNTEFYFDIHSLKKHTSFDCIEIINQAFYWEYTSEGSEFWIDLSYKMNEKFLKLMQNDVI